MTTAEKNGTEQPSVLAGLQSWKVLIPIAIGLGVTAIMFANEYGNTAFQKIYDVDIANESSGVTVDTIVMSRQMTYVARRISPLIRGVYSREEGGIMKGVQPVTK